MMRARTPNEQEVLDEDIRETLRAEGAGGQLRNGKLKGADYSADVALEALEGQFEEPSRKPAQARINRHQSAGDEIAVELAGLWMRRSVGWLDVAWRVAMARSPAAAAAQHIRGMTDALRDCRETGERIRARLLG